MNSSQAERFYSERMESYKEQVENLKETLHHKDVHIDDLKSDIVWLIGTLKPLMQLVDDDEEESDFVVSYINEILTKNKLSER